MAAVRSRLGPPQVVFLATDVVLSACHRRIRNGIAHCDLKPANIPEAVSPSSSRWPTPPSMALHRSPLCPLSPRMVRIEMPSSVQAREPSARRSMGRSTAGSRDSRQMMPQDLVDSYGFSGADQSVKRFIRKFRGKQLPEARAVIEAGSPGNGARALISTTACGTSRSRRTGENTSHIVESRTPIAPISSARRIPTACAMAPPASAPNSRTPWRSRCIEELTRPRSVIAFGSEACGSQCQIMPHGNRPAAREGVQWCHGNTG